MHERYVKAMLDARIPHEMIAQIVMGVRDEEFLARLFEGIRNRIIKEERDRSQMVQATGLNVDPMSSGSRTSRH